MKDTQGTILGESLIDVCELWKDQDIALDNKYSQLWESAYAKRNLFYYKSADESLAEPNTMFLADQPSSMLNQLVDKALVSYFIWILLKSLGQVQWCHKKINRSKRDIDVVEQAHTKKKGSS